MFDVPEILGEKRSKEARSISGHYDDEGADDGSESVAGSNVTSTDGHKKEKMLATTTGKIAVVSTKEIFKRGQADRIALAGIDVGEGNPVFTEDLSPYLSCVAQLQMDAPLIVTVVMCITPRYNCCDSRWS